MPGSFPSHEVGLILELQTHSYWIDVYVAQVYAQPNAGARR